MGNMIALFFVIMLYAELAHFWSLDVQFLYVI